MSTLKSSDSLCWTVISIFQVNERTNRQYPRLGILSQIGDNIFNRGLGIYESGYAESENKSPIPNLIKYHQLGI